MQRTAYSLRLVCAFVVVGVAAVQIPGCGPTPCSIDGADAHSRCEGTVRLTCEEGVLVEYDCAEENGETYFCGVDSDGDAWCTEQCPTGLTAFGRCEGNAVQWCNGAVYGNYDCTKEYDGYCVATASRYGASCRRDQCEPGATLQGTCSGGALTRCSYYGTTWTDDCAGGRCGWDQDSCSFECLDAPRRTCDDEGMQEGEMRCKKDVAYGFWAVLTCRDGIVESSECPPPAQGEEGGCSESGPTAVCALPKCDAGATRYCTDVGVLVGCDPRGWWIDCRMLGGECVDDGVEQYCSCTVLLESPMPCTSSLPDGSPARFACVNGRVIEEPCTCEVPPGGG